MLEKRAPRKLQDVSHLFLSGGESAARLEGSRREAVVWLASVGASANGSHLAAGLAHACAKQGFRVSLMEVSRVLPNIGYYFGMEPSGYLAPALDRSALVSGAWDGAIRYCFSADLSSFERYRGEVSPQDSPHMIVAAFPCPEEHSGAHFFSRLRTAASVLSENGTRNVLPDAVVVAGRGAHSSRLRRATAAMRETVPHSILYLASSDFGLSQGEADERFALSDGLHASWARRMPPADRFFEDLASSLSQVISQKRRKAIRHAANG